MQSLATLGIEVKTSGVDDAQRKLKGLESQGAATERKASDLARSWQNAGKVIGTAIGAGIGIATAALGLYIRNTIESERVQAQLVARIKSTGAAAGLAIGELNKMSAALQDASTFDDEAIGDAQALLLTFTKITRENFGRATQAVLDMSVAMGTDLKSSALQVGKALNDPVLGVTALARAGVQFSDAQKDVIKHLVETGQVAKAQNIVLRELETQMGGAALAARNTLGGALQALKNSFDNLLEGDSGDSGIVGARGAIESLISTMNDPSVHAGVMQIINGMAAIANTALAAIPKIVAFNNTLEASFGLQAQGAKRQANARDFLGGFTSGIGKLVHGDIAGAQAGADRAYAGFFGGETANFTNVRGAVDANRADFSGVVGQVDAGSKTATGGEDAETKVKGVARAMRDYSGAAHDAAAALREQQAAEDALLAKSLADENARTQALQSFTRLAAELQGPLKVAELDHIERMQQIQDLGKQAGVSAAAIAQAQAQEETAYRKTTVAMQEQFDAMNNPRTTQLMDEFRRSFANNLTDVVTHTKTAGQALKDFLNDMAAQVTQAISQNWGEKLFGQFGNKGGGLFGDKLAGLFGAVTGEGGGFGKDAAALSASAGQLAASAAPLLGAAGALTASAAALAAAGIASSTSSGAGGIASAFFSAGGLGGVGYATGGYTGDGPDNEIAGVVHRGEYVIPAPMVRAMRQGGGPRTGGRGDVNIQQHIHVQGMVDQRTRDQIRTDAARETRSAVSRNGG